MQIALLVLLPFDWLWQTSASNSLINYTSHNKSSILQLSGLLYYLLLTCVQNTNVSQPGSGCSHNMMRLFSQRSCRVPAERWSVSEMQLLQLFLAKRTARQTVVIDNRWKCTAGTFHCLRSTAAAQVHHLMRYGRENGPDVMDSYSTEIRLWWCWRRKKKKYQLLSSEPILAAREKHPCYFILCSFDEDECICAPPHLTLAVRVH